MLQGGGSARRLGPVARLLAGSVRAGAAAGAFTLQPRQQVDQDVQRARDQEDGQDQDAEFAEEDHLEALLFAEAPRFIGNEEEEESEQARYIAHGAHDASGQVEQDARRRVAFMRQLQMGCGDQWV